MPLLRQLIDVPELSAEEARELDMRAFEILGILPRDLGKIRYIHERVQETLDRWILKEREEEERQGAPVVPYLKVVD